MTTRQSLKRYQKQKFENYKKINEINVSDDEAYIPIRVNSMDDIISNYSVRNNEMLSEEFIDILSSKAAYTTLDYPLVVEILNDSFTSEEKILVRKLIKNHFSLITIDKETELKALKRKENFFLFIGIFFFLILFLLYDSNVFEGVLEVVLFISSFSLWEWLEIVIFEHDELTEQILLNRHLSKIRVVFKKDSWNKENML